MKERSMTTGRDLSQDEVPRQPQDLAGVSQSEPSDCRK
jgi:hypothetical protein